MKHNQKWMAIQIPHKLLVELKNVKNVQVPKIFFRDLFFYSY